MFLLLNFIAKKKKKRLFILTKYEINNYFQVVEG